MYTIRGKASSTIGLLTSERSQLEKRIQKYQRICKQSQKTKANYQYHIKENSTLMRKGKRNISLIFFGMLA